MTAPVTWSFAFRRSTEESGILEAVEAWPDRFADLGLAISTGPVVLFRAEEYLLPKPDGTETAASPRASQRQAV